MKDPAAAGKRPKILVVDDQDANLLAARTILSKLPVEISCARSGHEALSLLLRAEFAVILLDVRMPGMDGYETASLIREHTTRDPVPIIFLSAEAAEQHSIFQGYESGAVDYLLKPIDETLLLAKLRVFLELDSRKTQLKEQIDAITRLNKELDAARRLADSATRAKAIFLANMSHEIRTPLNAIIGTADLLRDTPLSGDQREMVDTLQLSGSHLLGVINDILDFSKIESGKLTLESRAFDPGTCVEQALDLVAQPAAEKKLELAWVAQPGVPSTITGDSTRVRQILVNYLSNAIKFTERGEILLTVSSERRDDGRYQLAFAVRDTGIGIPPERTERLFKAFSQADESTTRVFGGTGLGLVISKNLAQLMGGTAWVESEPGQGSTFHFSIVVPGTAASSETPVRNLLTGKHVLVVDGHAASRRQIESMARSLGVEVRATDAVAEALGWMAQGKTFDAAIIGLPPGSAEAQSCVDAIRKLPPAAALPLLLAAYGAAATENGYARRLRKPLHRSSFADALYEVLAPGNAGAIPEARPKAPTRLGLKILLAEDNPVNQFVATRMLKALGCTVDVVGDGRRAVDAVVATAYDLILMDVQMPVLDGLDATREICTRLQDRRPRIIAMTASVLERDRQACFDAGMDDYISKPVLKDDLANVLNRNRTPARGRGPGP